MPPSSKSHKILLAGVVPPPVHGQSMATKALFDEDFPSIEKILIEIRSSKELKQVGRLSPSKVFGLIGIVALTWMQWLKHRPTVLYYTAGSGAWVPFARDFLFLGLCRPLFRRTLIHYHSGDLVEFLAKSPFRSAMGKFIYGRGAWSIRLGKHCPAPIYANTKVFDVSNGVKAPASFPPRKVRDSFRILFLGNLFEEKGVIDLIQAVKIAATDHPSPITLTLMGSWPSENVRLKTEALLADLPANVTSPPPAPAYGDEKWQALATHDILVFPSYYRSENLPLILIEAMAASLPVIATDWRGIKSLVENEVTGLLVPTHAPAALAAAIKRLADRPALRNAMGATARLHYEQHLTSECYLNAMHDVFIAAFARS